MEIAVRILKPAAGEVTGFTIFMVCFTDFGFGHILRPSLNPLVGKPVMLAFKIELEHLDIFFSVKIKAVPIRLGLVRKVPLADVGLV